MKVSAFLFLPVCVSSFLLGVRFALPHALVLEPEPVFVGVPVPVEPLLGYEEGYAQGVSLFLDLYELDREAVSLVLSRYPAVEDPYECAGWILDAAREFKVPSFVLLGQFCQESSGRANVASSAGCVGVMQVNWAIWGEMLSREGIAGSGSDLKDTRTCIRAGARILRQLIVRYDGDLGEALRHYSGGARRYEEKVFARASGW